MCLIPEIEILRQKFLKRESVLWLPFIQRKTIDNFISLTVSLLKFFEEAKIKFTYLKFTYFQVVEENCYIDGLVQDWSNSIANALELLQSCTKPSVCYIPNNIDVGKLGQF